jgi:hypothetical protein
MSNLPIVRSKEDASSHDPTGPALVLVPGELVRSVAWLIAAIERPGDDEIGKTVRTLLGKGGKRE